MKIILPPAINLNDNNIQEFNILELILPHKTDILYRDLFFSDEDVCHFGSMVMRRGDELNQDTDYNSICVRCVCEVPPVPTCQRLPYDECDH